MAHRCVQCGREYKNSSQSLIKGCISCGGRKFYYVRDEERHREILSDKSPVTKEAAEGKEILEVPESNSTPDLGERVESIRIVSPGTYELNIEKMADSDERVVGIGTGGSYVVDLLSMVKPKKKKKKRNSSRKPGQS
jgi:predicted  nucleic acid-binding Zn-ribbon protein